MLRIDSGRQRWRKRSLEGERWIRGSWVGEKWQESECLEGNVDRHYGWLMALRVILSGGGGVGNRLAGWSPYKRAHGQGKPEGIRDSWAPWCAGTFALLQTLDQLEFSRPPGWRDGI